MDDDVRPRNIRYAFSLALASLFLNIDIVHFQPLALWIKIVVPVVLFIGLIGGIIQSSFLRIIGWLGIVLFFIASSATSFPSEEYVLGHYTGGPPEVSTLNIIVRLSVAVAITFLLAVTYRHSPKATKLRA